MKINISDRSKLEQLAEEAAELAQASLKLIRTLPSDNPTPIEIEKAWHNLLEEMADVQLCFDVLIEDRPEGEQCAFREDIELVKRAKRLRWLERLNQYAEPEQIKCVDREQEDNNEHSANQ